MLIWVAVIGLGFEVKELKLSYHNLCVYIYVCTCSSLYVSPTIVT